MFNRFKNAVNASAENRMEIGWITVASLIGGQAAIFMAYVVARLLGLIEW